LSGSQEELEVSEEKREDNDQREMVLSDEPEMRICN
jgi:hypothetical protein